MTNLSQPAGRLRTRTPCGGSRSSTAAASDGTARKFLFGTDDRRSFEAVLLRASDRDTICVSTQIGCAWRCAFCATAPWAGSAI